MAKKQGSAEGLTTKIAEHFQAVNYEAVPPQAIRATKHLLFDTLVVAIAGRDEAAVVEGRDVILANGGTEESRLWGSQVRVPAMSAAFVNGVAAAALDFDSVHEAGTVHSDIVVAPAVLALAEARGSSGKEVLTALALGDDLASRLGMSTREHSGWFYTSLHGGFAAAAASAKLIGLNAEGIRNAIGIMLSRTGGTQQPAREKAQTKRLQSAFAAQDGVFAALLAEKGVAAPSAPLEGEFGLYSMYEAGDPDVVLNQLGQRFENIETTFKAYPSCACNHAVICAMLEIVKDQDLKAEDVASIELVVTPYINRLVGAPFSPGSNPQVAAQFNMRYSVAAVLLNGQFGINEIKPGVVLDPRAAELANHMSVVVDENRTGEFGPVKITITCQDSHKITVNANTIPGRPDKPLTEAELITKGNMCLPGKNGAALFAAISEMEMHQSIEMLLDKIQLG
ncbi:MmgE/PrpD family protein [uncultured Sneathiella sp.]|uniref:MmgE/PrpD family protein n=1 Tax=uncultured Sneathiella sp. TaxID=879315 RepID=UPI0030ED2BF8|tara:strand:- start:18662 stop:20020 length:1359 start_codon:yes stop_codon:yes gene_type:complete